MTVFKSKISVLSGALALSLLASTATATPINLTYQEPSANDPKTVKISVTAGDKAVNNKNVYAYGFEMTSDHASPLDSFLAWCLDVFSDLAKPGVARSYTVTENPFTNSFGLDTAQRGRVQSVFDANYSALDVAKGVEAAGFQVALWDALYDDGMDAGSGVFKASGNAAVVAQANTYLTAAALHRSNDGGKAYRMTFLQSANASNGTSANQNLVTVSPVPLPAAGILLLAALGGLGFAGRRRKAS